MDLEFPDPEVNLKAEKLEDNWLMCPICIDAWQTDSKAGMVMCPKCKNVMHNPITCDVAKFSSTAARLGLLIASQKTYNVCKVKGTSSHTFQIMV
jgi:hypothetical protein